MARSKWVFIVSTIPATTIPNHSARRSSFTFGNTKTEHGKLRESSATSTTPCRSESDMGTAGSRRQSPLLGSLHRKQIVHQDPPHRSPERARNSRHERQKRFVDLRSLRLLREKEVRQPLHHRHAHSDQQHPAPRPSRAQNSKQHAGGTHT